MPLLPIIFMLVFLCCPWFPRFVVPLWILIGLFYADFELSIHVIGVIQWLKYLGVLFGWWLFAELFWLGWVGDKGNGD